MTELLIDGQPVALPEDFNIKIVHENPFYQKGGEYSYDIEISLLIPQNACIYGNIQRPNAESIPSNRTAILISDGRVVIRGREIILSNSNESVQLQIVSGNSELNYIAGSDKKVWELELGSTPTPTASTNSSSINNSYPNSNFANVPVMVNDSLANVYPDDNGDRYVQPYFLYYIEKILTVLGYKIGTNILRTDGLTKKILVINGISSGLSTQKYADFLPDWTVGEFLSETEAFCNVVFVVNAQTNTVDILRVHEYYTDLEKEYIPEANDEYKCELNLEEEKDAGRIEYDNVTYEGMSGDNSTYQCISDAIWEDIKRRDVSYGLWLMEFYTYDDFLNAVDWVYYHPNTNPFIYYVIGSDNYYIMDSFSEHEKAARVVNIFSKANNNTNILKLRIVPATIKAVKLKIGTTQGGSVDRLYSQVPVAPTSFKRQSAVIKTAIEGGVSAIARPSALHVAIYDGPNYVRKDTGARFEFEHVLNYTLYPCCKTDYLWVFATGTEYERTIKDRATGLNSYETLRLRGEWGRFVKLYNKSKVADNSSEYKFSIPTSRSYDVKKIFHIKDRDWICKKIEYEVNQDGFNPDAEITVCPKL